MGILSIIIIVIQLVFLIGSIFLTEKALKNNFNEDALMQKLGLYDLTPALCHLDYTMSEAGGVTNFVRQYTLASGGPYCDCGYKKKKNK